jgi:hypothetical protein
VHLKTDGGAATHLDELVDEGGLRKRVLERELQIVLVSKSRISQMGSGIAHDTCLKELP